MTDQEIIRGRMIEIIESHGYKHNIFNKWWKDDSNYVHHIGLHDNNNVSLQAIHKPTHDIENSYTIGNIRLDYEQLSLFIDTLHKNYN